MTINTATITTATTTTATSTTGRTTAPPPRSSGTPGAVAPPATLFVTAVLVIRGGAHWLPECLDVLARQSRPVDRLVVIDLASDDDSLEIVRAHEWVSRSLSDVLVGSLPATTSFGEAVGAALSRLGSERPDRAEWLWLLHDGAAEPTTLGRLLEAVRRSPSVAVAGPKVVQWDDPRSLVEVGQQITRSGRRVAAPAPGEPDQGQYDARTDVLAVGTRGMLVRRDVFEELGGFDPAFGQHGADLDFGWRAQLAGHRVVVVPGARMRDASAPLRPEREGAAHRGAARRAMRRAARRVALTRCALVAAPVLAVWILLSSLASAALLLVLKRPGQAWAELSDIGALLHPVASVRSRWRARGTKRLRRAHLTGLFVTSGEATRLAWDRFHDAITPERHSVRSQSSLFTAVRLRVVETGPVAEEAEDLAVLGRSLPQRLATHPGLVATVACAVIAGVAFRDALRSGVLDARGTGLAGGQLRAVATDSVGLWHSFRDSWHGAGLGTSAESGPYLAVLSALSWLAEKLPYVADGRSPASVSIAWLLLGAMPLSAGTAYLAGRVATRAPWPRALAALVWGTSAVLAAALSSGRVTLVLGHILLPFVLAGFALAMGRRGSFTATFGAALVTGVVGALVPLVLSISVAAALLMALIGPGWGRRARALVLLVVPVALLGPWVLHIIDDPRLLLAGPGLLDSASAGNGSGPATSWQLALGQPDGSRSLALLAAPLVALAVLSMVRHTSNRSRSVALSALGGLALVGLAAALASPRVTLGEASGLGGSPAPATLWTGVGLDVYLAALLAATLLGSRGLRALVGRGGSWRRMLAGAVAVTLTGCVVAAAAVTAWHGMGSQLAVGRDALPAVAVEQARGPLANRLLVIMPGDARTDYQLLGAEPGELLGNLDRAGPGSRRGSGSDVGPAGQDDPGLADLVRALSSTRAATGSTKPPGPQLADHGVGFVSLLSSADHPLVRTIDASSGLTRLGANNGQVLWRVLASTSTSSGAQAVPPARVRIVDAQGGPLQAVAVAGPHGAVDTQLPSGPAGRAVVFAEPMAWARFAEVKFDGQRLAPISGTSAPTYALGAGPGRLVVDLPPAHPRWFLAQLALLALVVFLAIPFGQTRSRRSA